MTQGRRPGVQGDANQTDSFAACVCAALVELGQAGSEGSADQIYLEGLSGAAFSPVFDEDEDCAAWWMEGGNDLRVDFLGEVLGFAAAASPRLGGPARREAREEYARSGSLPGPVATFWETARQAHADGAVLITGTWPTWSLVSGWSDDLRQLQLSTVSGFEGLCKADPLFPTYVLWPAPAQVPASVAESHALAFGVRVAAGDLRSEGYHYGPALYEQAAARLDQGSFCSSCGGREWSCAMRTLRRMRGVQMSAVGFLRRVGHFTELNGHLADALEHYEHMGHIVDRHLEAHRVRESWDDDLYRYQLKESFRHLAQQQTEGGGCLAAAAPAQA